MAFKIHVDLSQDEKWHRLEWERLLDRIKMSKSGHYVLENKRAEADCVLLTSSPSINSQSFVSSIFPHPLHEKRTFVWDGGDFPTGRMPGLYCSLPRCMNDKRRHRSFCYPIRYNEQVQYFDACDADLLWGFVGGITSGIRGRLAKEFADKQEKGSFFRIQAGPWDQMFDRTGVDKKIEYADALRRCRFFLCPRGNGIGSVRLFETMQAGRVPVIISDQFVLPRGIDWGSCSIVIRERDIAYIPKILEGRAAEWRTLAANARAAWEANYSDASLLDSIGSALRELLPTSGRPTTRARISYSMRIIPALLRRVGNDLKKSFGRMRKKRSTHRQ